MGGQADERTSRDSERKYARTEEFGVDKWTPLCSEREREKRERAGTNGADRRGPPDREGRARARLGWLGLVGSNWLFLFFLEFLIAFLFIFL
jgi:hypothetical protein